jgi:hypothetical protein
MPLSLDEAFTLTPVFNLKLAGHTYEVKPFTLGRFLRVAEADPGLLAGLFGDTPPTSDSVRDVAQWMARDVTACAPLAMAAVPGLTVEDWQTATLAEVIELFQFFAFEAGHDWALIAKTMFDKPEEEPKEPILLVDSLMYVAKEAGCSIQNVLAWRIEGFFSVAEGLRSRAERRQRAADEAKGEAEPGDNFEPTGGVVVHDKERSDALGVLLAQAHADHEAKTTDDHISSEPPPEVAP